MRSGEIDMALCCTHLASHLVQDDDRFSIYAPVVMNSELIAYQGEISDIQKIGVGQQRQYLQNLAKKSYPNLSKFEEIKTSMLPYSLSTDVIDAAILDVTKVTSLSDFQLMPLSNNDYISYVLVVSSDIVETEAFNQFIASYNTVIEKLNNMENSSTVEKLDNAESPNTVLKKFDDTLEASNNQEDISTYQQFLKIAGTKFLAL